jgi:uncharacterized protein YutE (UPF0331/DUF86 family)
MTYLVERAAELRRHLVHVRELRPRVTATALQNDLSLHNDVMFSLLTICQLVIDIAGDLSAQRGERFEKYADAIRNLVRDSRFDAELVNELVKLAGFRNVVVHEYISVDYRLVMEALDNLKPVQRFLEIVARGLK